MKINKRQHRKTRIDSREKVLKKNKRNNNTGGKIESRPWRFVEVSPEIFPLRRAALEPLQLPLYRRATSATRFDVPPGVESFRWRGSCYVVTVIRWRSKEMTWNFSYYGNKVVYRRICPVYYRNDDEIMNVELKVGFWQKRHWSEYEKGKLIHTC